MKRGEAKSGRAEWATLPAWTYNSDKFLGLEKEAIFLKTWQLVGHVSELRQPGDYLRFDLLGESAIVLRDKAGAIRAFHNVCRHRAFRLLDGPAGSCGRSIRCRYHGFVYDLDGRLSAVPGEEDFVGLERAAFGLKPVESETFLGLVFIRFGGEGPSVAEQLAPCRAVLEARRIEQMEPIGQHAVTPIKADWKVAVDNNIEAYHVPVAHPGLQRLYGSNYRLSLEALGVSHSGGQLRDPPGGSWSERHYLKLLPEAPHLPPDERRRWSYLSMFPSLAFDLYPDQIDYFQILPLAPGRCQSRSRAYALPDSRRETRAARWLNARINALVTLEDKHLVEGVQEGLSSQGYDIGLLSQREGRVKQFHDLIRAAIPEAALTKAPTT